MTFSKKLEKALDMATAGDDWNAAGKLIVFAFERGFIDAIESIKYRDALRRMIQCQKNRTGIEYRGPRYRKTISEQPLQKWARSY